MCTKCYQNQRGSRTFLVYFDILAKVQAKCQKVCTGGLLASYLKKNLFIIIILYDRNVLKLYAIYGSQLCHM